MPKAPQVIVLAGPNGAGKSTAAPMILPRLLRVTQFVNADEIAKGLSGFSPDAAALTAGRIMLERLRELADSNQDFAFETTLASRSYAASIREWRSRGYECHLAFFRLPNAEMAVQRVAQRVRAGGHDVDVETIKRRFSAGLRNFFQLYRPLADHWRMYDSSGDLGPKPIASGRTAMTIKVFDHEVWNSLKDEYSDA